MSTEKLSDHSLLLCWSSFFFIYPFSCTHISLLHVPPGNCRLLGALRHLQANAHSQGEIIPLACKSKWEIFFLMGILNLASMGMEIIKIHSSKSFIMEHKSYYYIFDHSSIILHGRKGENIMSTSWQLLNSFAMQTKETTKDLVTL